MNRCFFAIIVILLGCFIMAGCDPTMEKQTVITTGTNGVSVTNVVMVKKDNSEAWEAFFEALGDALEDIDFE
jgi:thiamine monophosphate synthase